MPQSDNAKRIEAFLNAPLNSLHLLPQYLQVKTQPPSVDLTSSTTSWAARELSGWSLDNANLTKGVEVVRQRFDEEVEFEAFEKAMTNYPSTPHIIFDVERTPHVRYSESEQDTRKVLDMDIIEPVFRILTPLVPSVGESKADIELQVFTEAYSPKLGTDTTVKGGTRIDSIFTLACVDRAPPNTTSQTENKDKYLLRNEIWRLKTMDQGTAIDAEYLQKRKTLTPVEVKQHGLIHVSVLEHIARINRDLGDLKISTDQVADDGIDPQDLKFHISILQQAIRYGHAYGADFVVLMDYHTTVILYIPENTDFGREDDSERELNYDDGGEFDLPKGDSDYTETRKAERKAGNREGGSSVDQPDDQLAGKRQRKQNPKFVVTPPNLPTGGSQNKFSKSQGRKRGLYAKAQIRIRWEIVEQKDARKALTYLSWKAMKKVIKSLEEAKASTE